MRAGCRLSVVVLAVAVLAAGCTARHDTSAHQSLPAPSDPDLGAVLERFYQQIEGRHWDFAYAMLSPNARATLSEPAFEARYAGLTNAEVTIGQSKGLRVPVHLDDAAHHAVANDDVTLRWDGEDWTIDALRRVSR